MALLSGIWLLVIFASLLLLIGTYTRVQNTGTAAEAAVYGSTWAVCSSGYGKDKAVTSFSYTLGIPYKNLKWEQKGMVKSKVIRPVLFIEKIEKARNLIDTVQNR